MLLLATACRNALGDDNVIEPDPGRNSEDEPIPRRPDGEAASGAVAPDEIGDSPTTIHVELSTRFLEQFSEQLYSSPQKAFEELISNGWDAGATVVDVRISGALDSERATMCVFDNGESMDDEGLRLLWRIAFSPKPKTPVKYGRQVIGRFGIGKLATYVLARKLTYICRGGDGVIRRVTMDYGEIDHRYGADPDRLISDLQLQVFRVADEEVARALEGIDGGAQILDLINADRAEPPPESHDDEFGSFASTLSALPKGTWTLVVLSGLKQTGRDLKVGVLKRMLEAALPIGSEMSIRVNGVELQSSKVDAPVLKEWQIGPDLGIDFVTLGSGEDEDQGGPVAPEDGSGVAAVGERIDLSSGTSPRPHIIIPGLGVVTGRIRLYEERISGAKSDERGASNGFHVNVLGRVVNQADASFGEQNLNHAAWARFRMAVRADGLNQFLTTDREKLRESRELRVFRAFLRKTFNLARNYWDADANAVLPDGGDVLVKSLGVLSLSPLRNVVSETLAGHSPLPDIFDETGIPDRQRMRESWRASTSESIRSALGEVRYESLDEAGSFVKFRIADSSVIVNKNHPFVMEHSHTKAEKELLRTVAMVTLLADVYALDAGIDPAVLDGVRQYRDRLMRFRALQSRKSGMYIAKLLLATQHDSENSRRLEVVVGDALRYLGLHVREIGGSGEPEGVASAFPLPTGKTATFEMPRPPLFSFTFDAKSSRHANAATGNLSLDAIVEHRERYLADYALVVAPGYSPGALDVRAEQQKVTPITASDLGRLLEYTVEYGAIPLPELQAMFGLHQPDDVSAWVNGLGDRLKANRALTIDVFLRALENLKGKVPDVLPAGLISYECRERLGVSTVTDADVVAVAQGLSILVPDLVGVSEDKIVVNASAARVAAAVEAQLAHLRDDQPVDDVG